MSAPSLLKLDLNDTFGAYLIGTFLSCMLYGVTAVQTFMYYRSYSKEPIVSITVGILFILETLHAAFSIHAIYFFVITNYLNPISLTKATWSATVNLGILGFIIILVHMFYIRRLYHLNGKKKLIPALICCGTIVHFGFWWALVGCALNAVEFENFHGITDSMGKVSLSLAVAIDISIAILLCYHLHRNRSGIRSKLMIYAINNGILTSVGDVFILSFLIWKQNTFLYLCVTQIVGNLYTNSLLATLNARGILNPRKDVIHSNTVVLSDVHYRSHPSVTATNGSEQLAMKSKESQSDSV